jgi:type III secretion system FlhB-like substrate exporter
MADKLREELCVAVGASRESTSDVLAVGRNMVARDILRIARRYGVPVENDTALALELAEAHDTMPEKVRSYVTKLLARYGE